MVSQFDAGKMETWHINPRGMMKYYQSQPYSLGQSIADLIDNCFDGGANNIDVKIDYDEEKNTPFIRVFDDGRGMGEKELKNAMALGIERTRKDTELGVFGIGMKLSSLAQANQVTVVSVKQGAITKRRIDANYIREKNENLIQLHVTNSEAYKVSEIEMIEENWTTMVLLEEIHGNEWITYDVEEEVALQKELEKVKVHLQLTYHRILVNQTRKKLIFQGKEIKPLDPAMPWENDSRYGTVSIRDNITMKINGKKIIVGVDFVIIPHSLQFKVDKKKCQSMHKGYNKANDMQGLYLYRNKRLIQYGGFQGLRGDSTEEHDKCGKIMIDIPPAYVEEFGINPTKTAVTLPKEFMRKLSKMIKDNKRRWGNIKSGKEISYGEAIDYRYRNEGKKAIARDKKKQGIIEEGGKGGKKPTSTTTVPVKPGSKSKKSSSQPKPKPVVTNIDESDPRKTSVILEKSRDGYQKLIEYIRMWKD